MYQTRSGFLYEDATFWTGSETLCVGSDTAAALCPSARCSLGAASARSARPGPGLFTSLHPCAQRFFAGSDIARFRMLDMHWWISGTQTRASILELDHPKARKVDCLNDGTSRSTVLRNGGCQGWHGPKPVLMETSFLQTVINRKRQGDSLQST